MPATFDRAIVLRMYDWSETSQIAVLLTEQHGLVRALAKGSRRPVAKFSGGFELLTAGTAGLVMRPESELATCTEWDLTEPFWHLRRSLDGFYRAVLAAELLQRVVIDRDPHAVLFACAMEFLASLREQPSADGPMVRLLWAALRESGWQPEVGAMLDGSVLPAEGTVRFSPELGGVIGAEEVAMGVVWPVRAGTLRRLAALAQSGEVGEGPETRRAARLLVSYAEYVLAQPLLSRRFCFPELSAATGR
jgi:DNA repair protein RecO